MPTACTIAKTGKYDGISSVYRLKLASAYVVDPEKPMEVPKLALDEERMQAFLAIKANTIKGAETRVPQPVPPGTTEAAVGSFEHDIADLPSKDFFIKTLDRPHYANEDKDGIPPWMRRRRGTVAPPAPRRPHPSRPSRRTRCATKNRRKWPPRKANDTPAGDIAGRAVAALCFCGFVPALAAFNEALPYPTEVALSQEGDKGFVFRVFPAASGFISTTWTRTANPPATKPASAPARRSMPRPPPSRWGNGPWCAVMTAACNGPIAAIRSIPSSMTGRTSPMAMARAAYGTSCLMRNRRPW